MSLWTQLYIYKRVSHIGSRVRVEKWGQWGWGGENDEEDAQMGERRRDWMLLRALLMIKDTTVQKEECSAFKVQSKLEVELAFITGMTSSVCTPCLSLLWPWIHAGFCLVSLKVNNGRKRVSKDLYTEDVCTNNAPLSEKSPLGIWESLPWVLPVPYFHSNYPCRTESPVPASSAQRLSEKPVCNAIWLIKRKH